MKEILKEWNSFLNESTPVESLRILDFDHTIAFTNEMVLIKDKEGNVVEKLDSNEFKDHELSKEEIDSGHYYDFSEFNDVDIDTAVENPHVTKILRNFVKAKDAEKRIILILTARSQKAENGIRNLLKYLNLDGPNIEIKGVESSLGSVKAAVVEKYLNDHPNINRVSFYDDSGENVDAMNNFLKSYVADQANKKHNMKYQVAIVNEDGTLTRVK